MLPIRMSHSPQGVVDILSPDRKILREGILRKRKGVEIVDIHLFLFDNYLMLTKTQMVDGEQRYEVHKMPMNLELLVVSSEEPPTNTLMAQITRKSSRSHGRQTSGFSSTDQLLKPGM